MEINERNEENSPYIIAIGFKGVRAETLLHKMDEYGVLIGNGSACSSKKSGNRILSSMGVDQKVIESRGKNPVITNIFYGGKV